MSSVEADRRARVPSLAAGSDDGGRSAKGASAPGWLIARTVVVGVLGLLLTGLVSAAAWSILREQSQLEFEAAVQQSAASLADKIDDYDNILYGLRGAVVSDPRFDRTSFHASVQASEALQRLPGVRAVQFATLVPRGGAAAFEQQTNSQGIRGVADYPELVIHPPLTKPQNYVVEYVEPIEGNSQALGLNLSGLEGRQALADAARASGERVVSGTLPLVLEDGERPGYVVYLPVYNGSEVPATESERIEQFRGLLIGVFVGDEIMGPVADTVPGVDFTVHDAGPIGSPTPIPAGEATELYSSAPGLDVSDADAVSSITHGGRNWNIYYFDSSTWALAPVVWLIPIAGLALTGLLMLYVWSNGRHRIQSEEDLRRIKESEETFQTMSLVDPLTGLANRRSLMRQLGTMMELAQRNGQVMTLLFLDVDGFKSVNDLHGHKAGDDLLREVGCRLEKGTRGSDLVGRMSGDEFCVAGIVADSDAAHRLVTRVRESLAGEYRLADGPVDVPVSIGAAVSDRAGEDVEGLLDAADHAMYQSKSRGGGRVVWFDETLERRKAEDTRTIRWLHEAAEQGAFTLVYQPILDLAARRVVQVEALLRLTPPDSEEMIAPARFLEVAERSQLIRPLGKRVIERALADLRDWRTAHPGSDLSVSINLSASQAADPGTIDTLRGCLAGSSVPADRVFLELTETAVFSKRGHTRQFFQEVSKMGLRLSIDDYGIGYSNLESLASLDVQMLKLDRSLTSKVIGSKRVREIVGSVVRVAPHLRVQVIGEGVEDADELLAVRDLGIGLAQGFFIARPRPTLAEAAEIEIPEF